MADDGSITCFSDLSPLQRTYVITKGPDLGDGGSVKSFVGEFEREFGVKVRPTDMALILKKAKRKKTRGGNGGGNSSRDRCSNRVSRLWKSKNGQ